MKSSIWYACVIAVLLVSTIARSDIVNIGDWYGVGSVEGNSGLSSASGYGDGDNPTSFGYGHGWQMAYTTEAAWLYWYYYLYTFAEAEVFLWSNQICSATADALASGFFLDENDTISIEAHAELWWVSGYGGEYLYDKECPEPNGKYMLGGQQLESNDCVCAQHTVFAAAAVMAGTSDRAISHACARGLAGMYKP